MSVSRLLPAPDMTCPTSCDSLVRFCPLMYLGSSPSMACKGQVKGAWLLESSSGHILQDTTQKLLALSTPFMVLNTTKLEHLLAHDDG